MFANIFSWNSLVFPKRGQLLVAFIVALFFAIPMPAANQLLASLLPQPAVALAADSDHNGAVPFVMIGNRLWLEDDYDGIAATGTVKPVGAGYLVTALASNGVTVYTALTNANGYYTILVPPNDTYTLTAAQPAGMGDSAVWTNTGNDPNSNDRNHNRLGTTVMLTTTDNLSIDFAFNLPTKRVVLGDRLWLEDDNDGDATTGTVTPVAAGHGVTALASDGVTAYHGVTDDDGYYIILVPEYDTYTVTTDRPGAVNDTPVWTKDGDDPLNHNDKNHERLGTAVFITETDNLSIDFGFFVAPQRRLVSLGNVVWVDRNYDGLQNDSVDPATAGLAVTLLNNNSQPVATTTTDANGRYAFVDLAPGEYVVTVAIPAGYGVTSGGVDPDDDASNVDSNALLQGAIMTSRPVTLTPGDEPLQDELSQDGFDDRGNGTVDFGLVKLLRLGDFVWEDLNNNGQQDSGEPGIPQVLVTLTRSDGSTSTTNTNANGIYGFSNLRPNSLYTVTFATPVGYAPTSANSGADATDSDPVQGRVFVALGLADDLTIDAGFVRPVTVGDRVWYDHNHDGRQDSAASEPGVVGVVATLYQALTNQPVLVNGAPMTDLTDNNGLYLFEKLPPGAYFAVFSNLPVGYQPTLQNRGDDAGDSDAGADGRTPPTAFLPSGAEDRTLDLGIWQASASLGDFVWDDFNHNGVQDGDEPGIPNVTVTLISDTDTSITTTDATGHYSFTHLLPSALYTVIFDTPAGYTPTLLNSSNDDSTDSDGLSVNVPPLQPGEHNPTIDSGFVQLRPNLVLTKQAMIGAQPVQPGAIVSYTLTYQNTGNDTAVDVVITETVSAQTTFVTQARTPGWSCNNGAVAGTKCTIKVGNVLPGQSGEVTFAIKINLGVSAGTQIANIALIGTTGHQVEGVSTDNEDEVTIITTGPTALMATAEPDLAAFHLYLPVITK